MIEPLPFARIALEACLMARNGPTRLIRSSSSHCSAGLLQRRIEAGPCRRRRWRSRRRARRTRRPRVSTALARRPPCRRRRSARSPRRRRRGSPPPSLRRSRRGRRDHLGAFGGEQLGARPPDAARRAGDQRDLALQPSHRFAPLLVCAAIYGARDRRGKALRAPDRAPARPCAVSLRPPKRAAPAARPARRPIVSVAFGRIWAAV